MENQLHLRISSTPAPDWQLDDSTRAIGRSGIALARAALEQARRSRSIGTAGDRTAIDPPDDRADTDHTDHTVDNDHVDHTTAA